jgi:hypothetical protein
VANNQGVFSPGAPIGQEIGGTIMFAGQETAFQPDFLAGLGHHIAQALPGFLTRKAKQVIGLLAQGVVAGGGQRRLFSAAASIR